MGFGFTVSEDIRFCDLIISLYEQGSGMYGRHIKDLRDMSKKALFRGTIIFQEFIEAVVQSCTNVLKKSGLFGYHNAWCGDQFSDYHFPVYQYLRTLDSFNVKGHQYMDGMEDGICYEIDLLNSAINGEFPKFTLSYCMEYKSIEYFEDFLSKNPSEINKRGQMDRPGQFNGLSPLLYAASNRRFEEHALLLIKYGADINAVDQYGCTTLDYAVQSRSIRLSKKLIEMNRDLVNRPDKWDNIPLRDVIPWLNKEAPDADYYRVIDLLLENGADLYHAADNKVTPLSLIAVNGKAHPELIDHIDSKFPDLHIREKIQCLAI